MGSRRVCFVVSDLLGLVTNSGIGTATSYASLVLAAAGHEVTLVHAREGVSLVPSWAERYRGAGVEVEAVPPAIIAPGHLSSTYRIYEHLKERDFDAIVFQDWLALGWASMQAKHCGLAFERTHLVHICHGREAWLHEANLQVAVDVEDLALAYAGRRSAELADAVMGPSRYLVGWMEAAGWCLPDRRFVVPYFTEGHARAALGEPPLAAAAGPVDPVPLREIAFFGRLERRKGVHVFVEGLNRVDTSLLEGVTVSFLGREATFKKHEVVAMFAPAVRRAVRAIEFHSGLDNEAACTHLSRPGTLAVIASLVDNSPNTIYECIERRIPFVATATGGTPELLAEEDRERCLVAATPAAMGDALGRLLGKGGTPEPAGPAFDVDASLRGWDELLAWEPSSRAPAGGQPLVTAVLTHHDRPALVMTAVEALDAQDYEDLEIVVVDDGSTRPESEQVLRNIEEHRWRHDLRVLRQGNRYLGAARNAGAAAGRGELVVFVDDDDVPVPRFVSTLVRAARATGADVVTCAMTSFNKAIGAPEPTDSRGTWVFAGGPLHLAAVQNCIGGAPALIRRAALEEIGGYHERHGVGLEDWHLYVRLLFAGFTVEAVPEALYWYRLHDTSMRHTMSDYHSVEMILGEFRKALPPALQPLLSLSYGQGVLMRQRFSEFAKELDLRERVLWLAEERLEQVLRAGRPDAASTDGAGDNRTAAQLAGELLRRGLVVGRAGLRRLSAARPGPPHRSG